MATDLLELAKGLAPWVQSALVWVGLITVTMSAIVKITPTKKDDDILKKIESLPIIGDIWKALEKFSVLERKKK